MGGREGRGEGGVVGKRGNRSMSGSGTTKRTSNGKYGKLETFVDDEDMGDEGEFH